MAGHLRDSDAFVGSVGMGRSVGRYRQIKCRGLLNVHVTAVFRTETNVPLRDRSLYNYLPLHDNEAHAIQKIVTSKQIPGVKIPGYITLRIIASWKDTTILMMAGLNS